MRPLLVAAAGVLLCGCASRGIAYRTTVEVCPAAPPVAVCPDWPRVGPPETLREGLVALGQGWAAWDACRAASGAWERSWRSCAEEGAR